MLRRPAPTNRLRFRALGDYNGGMSSESSSERTND